MKGILILGPPVVETWLPLLSHQGDSSDNGGSSSTPGIFPVKRGLSLVGLDIPPTFGVRVVIPFTGSNAMAISVWSARIQEKQKCVKLNNTLKKYYFFERKLGSVSSLNL